MLEWLVLLAGTLLFIINLSESREHATNPPPSDQTPKLPDDLKALIENYKPLRVAATTNPDNAGATKAASNAKVQLDVELAQWQEDIDNLHKQIEMKTEEDTGLGSDVATLHQQVSSYEKTLPELQDTLTKSHTLTAERIEDTTMMIAKAVAIFTIGVFAVFVSGMY
jgi:chromosome segregation ATPase